jgi:hypothetical protein
MQKGLWAKVFSQVEPPRALRAALSARLAALEVRRARLRVATFGALAALVGLMLVPAAQYAAQQFYASGFASYLSLIVSDRAFVMTYWQEFGLSLAEALPSVALLVLLPLVAVLVWALRQTWDHARIAYA